MGSVVTWSYDSGPLGLSAGAHGGWFTRDHFLDEEGGDRRYINTGTKSEADAFAKATVRLGRWRLYGDAQLRRARFGYDGDVELGSIQWTFFNPKIGARFDLRPSLTLYGSVGRATREPARSDMLYGEDNATTQYDLGDVKPETVVDFEAGIERRGEDLEILVDVYDMEFRDEIARTGELSAIGLPVRRNVDRSYRRGIEADVKAKVAPSLWLRLTANASRNRIETWTQFYDRYDADGVYAGSEPGSHTGVPPLLTPELTAGLSLDWTPVRGSVLGLAARFSGRSHLDNTGNDAFVTPSAFVLDASGSVPLARLSKAGAPLLRVQINNLLDDRDVRPSGYDYLYRTEQPGGGTALQGTAYYYPLATRSVSVSLEWRL